ncbi:hypothetical protein SLEP1_g48495 [Rubroshorea leprosula]|uniref:Uncharacterized protein n=1 Tax=Rubroshorea leprosula TaxID=152421 RepID=A0AAV5LW39_9ROSI|nr:hypothetical protein SLEP1_g48495 [Rubroshorea leprosula]
MRISIPVARKSVKLRGLQRKLPFPFLSNRHSSNFPSLLNYPSSLQSYIWISLHLGHLALHGGHDVRTPTLLQSHIWSFCARRLSLLPFSELSPLSVGILKLDKSLSFFPSPLQIRSKFKSRFLSFIYSFAQALMSFTINLQPSLHFSMCDV